MEILISTSSFESFVTNPFQENQFLYQKGGNLYTISNRSEILKNVKKGSFFSSKFPQRFHLFSKYYLIFHLIFCLVGSVSTQSWDGVVVTESDYQSLQAFKHELIDPNGFLKSWNDSGNGACSGSWLGIKCAKGQVIVIQLPWKGLRGRLTEKIGLFQSLRKLSLHNNAISGLIPTSLGFLPNLRGLQLFNNKFSGSIPRELGLCRLLQALDFSNNSLSGSIPFSIVNSTKLFRLNLSYNQLSGEIPVSVMESSSLVLLSLEYNTLSGSIPNSFVRLSLLQDINLGHNQLSGVIPNGIGNLSEVTKIVLSDNFISGTLPVTLYNLQKLRVLDLSYNNLSGEIPASLGDLPSLDSLNVSYNNLSGLVPVKLSQKFNSSAFVGNVQLCGYSSSTQCPIPTLTPPSQRPKNRRKLGTKDILLILAGVLFILLLLMCFVLTWCLLRMRKTEKDVTEKTDRIEKGNVTNRSEMVESSEGAGGKLVHFDGSVAFSVDDLLCANAEILGKSSYGTVYRATMEDGIEVAVKRLKQRVTIEEMEFESEVSVLGKIRHPTLLALRAYYLGPKGEKLLVFYYMNKGSLATFLHGRSPNTRIDWPTRMRIAKGMARGLFYLHNNLHIIHGNLKSTNILLDDHQNVKVADYGLWRLMTDPTNANLINMAGALGYRAPELSNIKKVNAKTDVYSLGVIMLELLTGKPPGNLINGVDLPRWVASTVNDEWANEVFDLELIRDESSVIGGELLNTLKLALHCVDEEPDLRPEAYEVLQQLEDIRPDVFSSSGDESVTFPSPGGD